MVQEAAGRTLTLDEYLGADYFNRVSQAQRHLRPRSPVSQHRPAALYGLRKRHQRGPAARREAGTIHAYGGSLRPGHDDARRRRRQSDPAGEQAVQPMGSALRKQAELPLRISAAPTTRSTLSNRAPEPGEEAEYQPSALDSLSRVIYGGIAFLPNLNRGSNVLILQGTSMAGLEVALEVLDNPALFRDLVATSHRGPEGRRSALFRSAHSDTHVEWGGRRVVDCRLAGGGVAKAFSRK